MTIVLWSLAFILVNVVAAPVQNQMHRSGTSAGCISKYYNKDLGPLEILMTPLGEKLWLRAWLGMHMSNLLHMEGVDLAEVSQTEPNRNKRDISLGSNVENQNKIKTNVFGNVAPYSYRLLFRPVINEDIYRGELHINITCLHPSDSIIIHADSYLKVDQLKIERLDIENISNQDAVQNEQEGYMDDNVPIIRLIWYDEESLCEIVLEDHLVKGAQYQLIFKYEGSIKPRNDAIIFHTYQYNNSSETSWLLGTDLKQDNVMKVMPCFYGSKYKATFEIIVVHPVDMIPITSSALLSSEHLVNKPGWIRSDFKVTPPMAPSSLAIYILNPLHFNQSSVTADSGLVIQGFVWKNNHPLKIQRTLYNMASDITFLEERLGVPFPLQQLNVIFMPNKSDTAQDFLGLILTGRDISSKSLLLYLLNQWFGHFVTATSVNEEYVTRSLAYYYAYFCFMDLQDRCETGNKPFIASHADFIALQDLKERMTIQDYKDHKMVLFLRMLNFSLREESFQKGIQVFLKYRSYSTFVEEDLWDALDIQAWSDGTLDRTLSTKDISRNWLLHDLQPLVTIHISYANSSIFINQQIFVRHWPYTVRRQNDTLWQIPVSFISESDLKEEHPGTIFWMKEKTLTVQTNVRTLGEYYIGNPNNGGMFMVTYADSNWKILTENLLFEGANQHFIIPANMRANLLRNAWYLAVNGYLDLPLALNLTSYLKHEKDLSVWRTFAEVYFMVSWKLTGTGVEIKFDSFIGDLILPLYENESANSSKVERKNFKDVEALTYYVLCKAGYEPVIEKAKLEFNHWLTYHHDINHGIVGGVLRWVDEDWERGLQHVLHLLQVEQFSNIRSFLLTQLAGNPNKEKIKRLLGVLLIDPMFDFTKAEIMNVLPVLSSCKTFLEFLTTEWQAIKQRYESEPNIWQYILEQAARKCKTPDGFKRVESFYKSHQNELGTAGNSMKHNIEVSRRDMEVVYHQIPAFEETLNRFL